MPSAKRIVARSKPADACRQCKRSLGDLRVKRCPKCPAEPEGPLPCPKCRERPGRTSFGLCKRCYNDMPLAERSKLDRRDRNPPNPAWSEVGPPPAPRRATEAAPGSFEKLCILAERIDAGLDPWHEDDADAAPVGIVSALAQMCFDKEVGGVAWCNWNKGWRARPWFTPSPFRYQRYHLGYYPCQEHAVMVVREWRELAEKIGPQKAMHDIRKKWAWARYPLFQTKG